MRFATVAAAALAATPSLVSAGPAPLGFALGTKKPDGSCKAQSDYEADFRAIAAASSAKIVRGYAASDCNFAQNVLPAAKNNGFQVIFGIWPDVQSSFDADTGAIQQALPGNEAALYAITVGSETLYRGTFDGQQLLDKINQVKGLFPNVKVGTADSWNKYADGTADRVVQGGVTFLLINAFGFWQGQDISNATAQYFDDIMQAMNHVQNLPGASPDIEIWNGETGWPTTGGTNYGAAIAGTDNAATYWKSAVCGLTTWGLGVFYFEAFDEPWKPMSTGDSGEQSDETHWGAFDANRVAKFPLSC